MELSEAYEDFEGEVRCWGCQSSLEVVLHEGKLRSIRRISSEANGASSRRGEARVNEEER